MPSILLLEDSTDFRETITEMLFAEDYDVVAVSNPTDAFKLLHDENFDLVISDLKMPFIMDEQIFEYMFAFEVGIRTILELKWVFPGLPVIAITSAPSNQISQFKDRLQGVPILQKPFARSELLASIRNHLNSPDSTDTEIVYQ